MKIRAIRGLLAAKPLSGLTLDAPERADREVSHGMWYRHHARKVGVFEVLVRALGPHEIPSVGLQEPDDCSRVHEAHYN